MSLMAATTSLACSQGQQHLIGCRQNIFVGGSIALSSDVGASAEELSPAREHDDVHVIIETRFENASSSWRFIS